EAIELKYKLIPYIYTYARKAHDTGMPLMRALLLEYPNDTETYKINGQFLLGEELLAAPVVEKGAAEIEIYLPEGEWIDFNDKKTVYKGSRWITYNTPLNIIPLFVKKGSIIPMMPVMQYIDEKKSYPLTLEIFPAAVNGTASFELYEDDGETNNYKKDIFSKTPFSCLTGKDSFSIRVNAREEKGFKPEGQRNFIIKLHAGKKPKSVRLNAAKLKKAKPEALLGAAENDFQKLLWSWDEKSGIVYVKVP